MTCLPELSILGALVVQLLFFSLGDCGPLFGAFQEKKKVTED